MLMWVITVFYTAITDINLIFFLCAMLLNAAVCHPAFLWQIADGAYAAWFHQHVTPRQHLLHSPISQFMCTRSPEFQPHTRPSAVSVLAALNRHCTLCSTRTTRNFVLAIISVSNMSTLLTVVIQRTSSCHSSPAFGCPYTQVASTICALTDSCCPLVGNIYAQSIVHYISASSSWTDFNDKSVYSHTYDNCILFLCLSV